MRSQMSHQHLKVVTNISRLSHSSPTSTKPKSSIESVINPSKSNDWAIDAIEG